MLQNAKISVYYGTKESYEIEKQYKRIDENALYFIEGILYIGYELYSQDYKKVSVLPDVGVKNIIYINTIDSSIAIWNDVQNEWIYICEPYKTLQEANTYTDNKCVEVIDTVLKNIYTKDEVDNKFSAFENNIDWKEAVNTYNDIATTYPSPEDGWTVSTKDDDLIYRYNGTKWVEISAGVIPKATASNDGLFSKEDYTKLSGIATGAEANQNAFSNVVVGSSTVTADSKTDTLTLEGSNVTLTPDTTNDKVTIGITKDNVVSALGYEPDTPTEVDTKIDTKINELETYVITNDDIDSIFDENS